MNILIKARQIFQDRFMAKAIWQINMELLITIRANIFSNAM